MILISKWAASLLTLTALLACGAESYQAAPMASMECAPATHQLAIHDGFVQTLCGCALEAGTISNPPSPLRCQVAAGDEVLFFFIGTRLTHQIVPQDETHFTPSPVFKPQGANQVGIFKITIPESGSEFEFWDQFNQSLRLVFFR